MVKGMGRCIVDVRFGYVFDTFSAPCAGRHVAVHAISHGHPGRSLRCYLGCPNQLLLFSGTHRRHRHRSRASVAYDTYVAGSTSKSQAR